MLITIKVLVGLVGVLMALMWFQILINPQQFAEQLFLLPKGAEGLNTFRADVGGIFFSGAIFSFLALWKNNSQWLLAAALLMGGAALGRLTGLLMDGVNEASVAGMVFESVLVLLFLVGYKKLGK